MADRELRMGDPGYIPTDADIEADPSVSVSGGLAPLPGDGVLADTQQQQQPPPGAHIRAQGYGHASAYPPGQASGFQSQSPGMQNLNELYAIMARGADDPTAVMQDYVSAVQQQQVIDRQNAPLEQFLRLYGNVNPHDWTADSLANFHEHFVQTGQIDYRLLEEKQRLTSEENQRIFTAVDNSQKARNQVGNLMNLARRMDAAAMRGDYRTGIAGGIESWINRNLTGHYDENQSLRTDWERVMNMQVINALPPGVASDRDIMLVKAGYPPATASPAYLAAFARGMAKLQIVEQAYWQHQGEFLGMQATPAQLATSWNQAGRDRVEQAMRIHGLQIQNPTRADGSIMSDEEYAQQFYDSRMMMTSPNAQPTPGQPGNVSQRDFDAEYNLD